MTRYTAGDSKTYYLRNTTALKLKHDGQKTYYVAPSVGATGYSRDWYYVDSGGTSYYTSNGSTSVTLLGDSGTYYQGNGTRLGTATRYKGNGSSVTGRGTAVTAYVENNAGTANLLGSGETVYVPSSTGSYYLRGDSEVITPIGASSIKVTNNTRYKAGTRYNKTKYYEKTA